MNTNNISHIKFEIFMNTYGNPTSFTMISYLAHADIIQAVNSLSYLYFNYSNKV